MTIVNLKGLTGHKLLLITSFFLNLGYGSGGRLQAQSFTESNLPIFSISTSGQIIQDEPKINAFLSVRYKGPGLINKLSDTPLHYDGMIGIEYRGSSSQDFPKKPYGFETRKPNGDNLNVSLLGLPKENDWILNASYNDKTLMRDALAYILAGEMMPYAPRVRHIELQLDQQYQGIYLLVEKIKQDENRIDIDKVDDADNSGDALTGGYIVKIDKETGSNNNGGWVSPYRPFPGAWQQTLFQIDYPDEDDISLQQKNYIRAFVTNFEDIMNLSTYDHPTSGYRAKMDEQSILDYIILNEVTKNPDAYRLSTYFYKERDSKGGKMFFGPVWDFNLGFGNVDYCTQGDPYGLVIQRFNQLCPQDYWVIHFWWKKFLEDQKLMEALKMRWQTLRNTTLSIEHIHGKIDSMSVLLEAAQKRNFTKWPVLGKYIWPNYYVGNTYTQEVVYLKNWISNRLQYLDGIWGGPVSTTVTEISSLLVYPVPAAEQLFITLDKDDEIPRRIFCIDITGRRTFAKFNFSAGQPIEVDLSQMPAGYYSLRLETEKKVYREKFIIQE